MLATILYHIQGTQVQSYLTSTCRGSAQSVTITMPALAAWQKLGECNSGYFRLLRTSFTYLFGLKKLNLKATLTSSLIYPYCCSEFKMLPLKAHLILLCHEFLWFVPIH